MTEQEWAKEPKIQEKLNKNNISTLKYIIIYKLKRFLYEALTEFEYLKLNKL